MIDALRVNVHKTMCFPRADIGLDHDLVLIAFQVCLKKARKPNQPKLRFDLEKLRDSDVEGTFQTSVGEKFSAEEIRPIANSSSGI